MIARTSEIPYDVLEDDYNDDILDSDFFDDFHADSHGAAKTFKHTRPDYAREERKTQSIIAELVAALQDDALEVGLFSRALVRVLRLGHTAAAAVGRRAGGVKGPVDDDDVAFAATILQQQMPYLKSFVSDITAGRYQNQEETKEDTNPLLSRATMYGQSLWGTATAAWTAAQDSETSISWVAEADACPDCAELDAGSPYKPHELPTSPAAGDTQCLTNCRCWLQTS